MSGKNMDINALKRNLKELNDLSQNLLAEINKRNHIMQEGINDCRKFQFVQKRK
ncbi:hypothetical protein [Acanthamoeba polyphaga mimivirus]|uniref:Uncharacterized protein n=2 Tax=Megamimivirinae TaxID=3044648 RepID=A0A2L2DLZ6_MIMIV|nr:hypothetical protein MegaChil _gp0349 [Megavirus chiliensis]AEQ32820.1 hypothetical protein [Megavirus chiliensis]AVG46080.1 hypothetical protein [Acanthamoeba polyphaga mimivirus]AVG47186.1 hypothetical protein [Acanthamoeba polyphaga mimivirus]